jgi:cytosine/adenosine deaminase-related metal-dependent hydrolase
MTTFQPSSILLQGGTVVAYDHETESLDICLDSSVLVTGDRIVAIFSTSDNRPLPPSTEVVNVRGKIITPGFVDTHRHGWQTGLKTMCGNSSLAEYLFRYTVLAGVGEHYRPEDVYIGQLAGLHEAIYAGVTSILDHAHHTWSAEKANAGLQACVESGVRMWYCYFLHSHQPDFSLAEQMADLRSIAEEGRCKNSCVELGIAFDSFFNSSAEDVKRVLDLAK